MPSAIVYAHDHELAYYCVANNVALEPSQLFGKYLPQEDGTWAWQDGPVTDVVRNGGVLNLGELNFMADRIATVLFPLLDRRRQITLLDHKGEPVDAHEDLLVLADMNEGYQGTRPLNAALRNRFAIQLEWAYTHGVESKLLKSATLIEMAGKLRSSPDVDTPVSTNMLQEFEMLVQDMNFSFAKSVFINHFDLDERKAVALIVQTHSKIAAELQPKDESTIGYAFSERRGVDDREKRGYPFKPKKG